MDQKIDKQDYKCIDKGCDKSKDVEMRKINRYYLKGLRNPKRERVLRAKRVIKTIVKA